MLDLLLVEINTSYVYADIKNDEPQLGLYYIAEYVTRAEFKVQIKRYDSNEPIAKNLIDLLKKHSCELLGFYVDSENIWVIRRLIPYLKNELPNLCVVLGGPQITGNYQLAMKRIPSADIAVIGEGERPIKELLSTDYKNRENLKSILGLSYYDRTGQLVFTGKQSQSNDLDHYPFPYREKYAIDKGLIFSQILTGRGCVGRCAFCYESTKENNILRFRSLESVIEEIDYIIKNLKGQKFITFLDDTFIIDSSRTIAICNHLIEKHEGKIGWFCEARVDILKRNVHLLPLMKKAGLIRIQLGGESGSQEILDVYKKGMKIEDLLYVVEKVYEANIPSIYINFIIGGAFETIESFQKTLELSELLLKKAPGCVEVGCSLFTPYVGTPMYINPQKYGLKLIDQNLISGQDSHMVFAETENLNKYQILQLKDYFNSYTQNIQNEIFENIPKSKITLHYELNKMYNIQTNVYKYIQQIESLKRYFESIYYHGYLSIANIPRDILNVAIPIRLIPPISDGEKMYRIIGKHIKENSQLENAIWCLSAGKLNYHEIVYILQKNQEFSHILDLDKKIYDVYCKLDQECLVVWKTTI